jgi:hypothetical protein
MNTNSISVVGGFSWLNTSFQGSVGLAIDGQGHVAVIISRGGSAGTSVATGVSGIFGVNVSSSNARSVDALGGPFADQSAGIGDGLAAAGNAFEGRDAQGNAVVGGGATLGVGVGARMGVGASDTTVIKLSGYGGC